MVVWGCKFDNFFLGGGGRGGVRIFQIWGGGRRFLGLSFPGLLGGGGGGGGGVVVRLGGGGGGGWVS